MTRAKADKALVERHMNSGAILYTGEIVGVPFNAPDGEVRVQVICERGLLWTPRADVLRPIYPHARALLALDPE